MVGLTPLKRGIGVQIPAPQQYTIIVILLHEYGKKGGNRL